MKPGRVYRKQELKALSKNLTRDLNSFVKNKSIVRVTTGLYYRPKMTSVGPRPASIAELVRAFLSGRDFLLFSLDDYNPLGLGLTQLYNETIVYNRRRSGRFVLDGRRFSFRRRRAFPLRLTIEFLYVEVLNNKHELLEDTTRLETLLTKRVIHLDRRKLAAAVSSYGKVRTKRFYAECLTRP